MTMFCILAIGGNIVVVVTVLASRKLRTVTSVFLLNLTFCDFFIGVMMMPLAINGVVNQRWTGSETGCVVSGFLVNMFCTGSALTVSVIALDRYFAIIHCLQYSMWPRKKYGGGLLMIIWTHAFLFSALPATGAGGEINFQSTTFLCFVYHDTCMICAISSGIMCVVIPMLIMIFCYSRIIKIARQHAKRICDINAQSNHSGCENNCKISLNGAVAVAMLDPIRRLSMLSFPTANINFALSNGDEFDFYSSHSTKSSQVGSYFHVHRETRALVKLIALILVFAICWIPLMISNIKNVHDQQRGDNSSNAFDTISIWLIAMHSCLNPFLYAIVSQRFRSALRILVTRNKPRHSTQADDESRRPSFGTYAAMLQSRRSSQNSRSGDHPKTNMHASATALSIISFDNSDIDFCECPHSILETSVSFSSGKNSAPPKRFLEVPDSFCGQQSYENRTAQANSRLKAQNNNHRIAKLNKQQQDIAIISLEDHKHIISYSPVAIEFDLVAD